MIQQIYKQLLTHQYVPRWVLEAPRLQRRSTFIPTMNVFITSNNFIIIEDQMQIVDTKDIEVEVKTSVEKDNLYCFKGSSGDMTLTIMNYEVPKGYQICSGFYVKNYGLLEYKFYDDVTSKNYLYNFDDTPIKFHFVPIMPNMSNYQVINSHL